MSSWNEPQEARPGWRAWGTVALCAPAPDKMLWPEGSVDTASRAQSLCRDWRALLRRESPTSRSKNVHRWQQTGRGLEVTRDMTEIAGSRDTRGEGSATGLVPGD